MAGSAEDIKAREIAAKYAEEVKADEERLAGLVKDREGLKNAEEIALEDAGEVERSLQDLLDMEAKRQEKEGEEKAA